MVGVNPEVAHETMAGLSFVHGVGQALWAGKLFHIDLNGQDVGRYDQDFRFGAEDLKEAFLLVRLLERAGYEGPRHFDAHAFRNEDAEGVWDFAAGCMRTYLALAERARRFDELPEVQEALAAASTPELGEAVRGRRRRGHAEGRGRRAGRARRPRLRQRAARPAAGGGAHGRALGRARLAARSARRWAAQARRAGSGSPRSRHSRPRTPSKPASRSVASRAAERDVARARLMAVGVAHVDLAEPRHRLAQRRAGSSSSMFMWYVSASSPTAELPTAAHSAAPWASVLTMWSS